MTESERKKGSMTMAKPTIEELEALLKSEEPVNIEIRPDGSIKAVLEASAISWPDPTPEMLADNALFDAIWEIIKTWDISVPGAYIGYCGATGNHARAIYDAVQSLLIEAERRGIERAEKVAEAYAQKMAKAAAKPHPITGQGNGIAICKADAASSIMQAIRSLPVPEQGGEKP